MAVVFYNRTIIEEVCGLLSDVSDNVYPEHRPLASTDQAEDLVVVDISSWMKCYRAYQKGVMRITVFAKDRAKGQANTVRLQELVDGITAKLPIVRERYTVYMPAGSSLRMRGSDGLGYTYWRLDLDLQVNTIDSYTSYNV